MEVEGTAGDSAKRIIELESKCHKIEEEKIKRKEELMGARGKEGRTREKYGKLKEGCVKMEEEFDSGKRNWREEGGKLKVRCWQVELEKKLVDIDLKAAEADVHRLKGLLEERDALVTHLSGKADVLERRNSKLGSDLEAAEMRLQEAEKARISELLDLRSFLEEEDGTSGVVEKESTEIKEEELVDESDAGIMKYTGTASASQDHNHNNASAMYLECQEFSDVSHSATKKKSSDQAPIELKGHNGLTLTSKMLCNEMEVSFAAKSKYSDNIQISKGSNNEFDDPIITRCTAMEVGNLSHKGIECSPLVASQTIAGNSIVPQKRKVEALGCSVEKQIGTKQDKIGGHVEPKLKWESASKMFNAFTTNHELCMKSVCALYRKHKSLGQWNICSPSSNRGFKPKHETVYAFSNNFRGMALGEVLTNGDPEGLMKKSLAEFKQADPRGLEDCRLIARSHHLELFEIYKNNLDPLFKPDENI